MLQVVGVRQMSISVCSVATLATIDVAVDDVV
jgi:hypothetical protein